MTIRRFHVCFLLLTAACSAHAAQPKYTDDFDPFEMSNPYRAEPNRDYRKSAEAGDELEADELPERSHDAGALVQPGPYLEYSEAACAPCEPICNYPVCNPQVRKLNYNTCSAGFEFTFVKPRFEENIALTATETDGATFESFNGAEFDYDLELSPRVWLAYGDPCGIGWRVTWWQFDHEPSRASANPPANGFGLVSHPEFGNVDISSEIATDTFSAASALNAYTIDLEATRQYAIGACGIGFGCGLRYAYAEQSYAAELRNVNDILRGQIGFRQSIEGFGPTVSMRSYVPWTCTLGLICNARASVLFGDGESRLNAGEDLDLTAPPFITSRSAGRDDLLSIGEIQLGFRWRGLTNRCRPWTPYLAAAIEGQIWHGAGNATTEVGELGFFGFVANLGVDW